MIARRLVLSSILVMLAVLIICLASGSVQAQAITVHTNKDHYEYGEDVTVYGHIEGYQEEKYPIEEVWISLHSPPGGTDQLWQIKAETNGDYSITIPGWQFTGSLGLINKGVWRVSVEDIRYKITSPEITFTYGTGQSQSESSQVQPSNDQGATAVTSVVGGLVGVITGVAGPILVSWVASSLRGTQSEESSTEESEGISEKELQEEDEAERDKRIDLSCQPFTHPHEWDRFTRPDYELEKDPSDRRRGREIADFMAREYKKWLRSLSKEDRDAETNRTSKGLTVTDEYILTMDDRPAFMRRYDDECRAEAKARRAGWKDNWIVSRANDGDLKAMSPAEKAQYDQWIKRLDSFQRRHGDARTDLGLDWKPGKLKEELSGFTSTAGARDAGEGTPRPPWVR